MADLRIVDAPEIPTENITGEEKLPTGGNGNYSISLDSLTDYTKTKKDLADNTSVDNKVNGVRQELNAHTKNLSNPHQVTKGQVGLGNVDNTADADKPVSNSTQAAIISAVTPKADKTYVDSQLALKANKADVYTKAETYTKQESSDLVSNTIATALNPVNTSLELAKRGVINKYDSSLTYNSGERVILTNGDIVKSTVANNTTDPNVDMTGWVNPKAEQDTINNISLDPNLAPLGWTQKDFNDSVVDVRKFIKKDMSNVTTGLQAAIEEAYGQTLLIPIPLKPLDTIHINQGLNIVGTRRSTKNYATDVPALDFRSLGAGKHAIYVAESASVIGFGMSDFTIFGNRNGGAGIKMGTDISKNMSDFSIENILLYNFTTAMEKAFVWDGLFKNLRVQSCTNGIKYLSQTNALLYSQCRIVGIDDMALQFINAEGIQFDACDISNLTKTNGTPITLYQSCVTMNTPYLENISNSDSGVTVGSTGEVIGSTLFINNPLKLGKNIKVNGPKSYVEINGQDRNQVSVVGSSVNIEVNAKVTKRPVVTANRKLFWWTAKQLPVFQGYGGTPTVTPNRDFANINSASAATGITLAANLEVGKVYTLRLAFRKGADFTAISVRHGAVNLGINIDEVGVAPTTRTYSFIATSTALSVTWAGNLEVFGFDIVEGNLNEQDLDPYNLSDFTRTVTVIRNAIPTVGTWRAGDRVENSAPTTYAGWVCTVAGTPGTWKQYGALV